jgi:hypothetical protein
VRRLEMVAEALRLIATGTAANIVGRIRDQAG